MKNIIQNIIRLIERILDWIGKNISRIKTVGIIVLFILFIISFANNGCNREYANKLVEKITGLDVQNDILSLKNRTLEDSLNKEKILRLQLEYSKTVLLSQKETLAKENDRLKKRIAGIPEWILNMPVDSSYKFLNEIAYPFPGEKRFPFNEPQVKNMHADYLKNIELDSLVSTLEDQLVNCEKIGDNRDSLVTSYVKSYKMAEEKSVNSETKAVNSEEKAGLYKVALDKSERKRKFWKTTTEITSALALVFGLLLL